MGSTSPDVRHHANPLSFNRKCQNASASIVITETIAEIEDVKMLAHPWQSFGKARNPKDTQTSKSWPSFGKAPKPKDIQTSKCFRIHGNRSGKLQNRKTRRRQNKSKAIKP
jgi:hypothetical protein